LNNTKQKDNGGKIELSKTREKKAWIRRLCASAMAKLEQILK